MMKHGEAGVLCFRPSPHLNFQPTNTMAHLTILSKPIIVNKGESLDGIAHAKSISEPDATLHVKIQPKFDGWRFFIKAKNGKVKYLNKHGEPFPFGRLSPSFCLHDLPKLKEAINKMASPDETSVWDCELLGVRDGGRYRLMVHTAESTNPDSAFLQKDIVGNFEGVSDYGIPVQFVHTYTVRFHDIPAWAHHYRNLVPDHPIEGVVRKTEGWAYIHSTGRRSKWFKHKPSEKFGRGHKCSEIFDKWYHETHEDYPYDGITRILRPREKPTPMEQWHIDGDVDAPLPE